MNLTYCFPQGTYSVEAKVSQQLIDVQTNNAGEFLYLPLNKLGTSQYSGLHHIENASNGWNIIKTLHSLGIDKESITDVHKRETYTEVHIKNTSICYRLTKKGLHVWSENMQCTITMDCRHIYDYSSQGRIYTVNEHKRENKVTVNYKKYSDDSLNHCEYEINTHIIGVEEYHILEAWKQSENLYDKRRNSEPNTSWVFAALQIKAPFSIFITQDETQKVPVKPNVQSIECNNKLGAYDAARLCAEQSLHALTVKRQGKEGIFAGLPWFFHWWTRDESISAQAYTLENRPDKVISILGKYVDGLTEDGRLPNRFPPANLGTADGTGWQMITMAKAIKQNPQCISLKDTVAFFKTVDTHLTKNAERHINHNLVYSTNDETWMDTNFSTDQRKGYCIEIQALALATWDVYLQANKYNNKLFPITEEKQKPYQKLKTASLQFFDANHGIADRIVERGGTLACDFTQRPNIFLAYYIYPTMYIQKQWEIAFDIALEKLWCPHTGLASIQTSHHLFCAHYTPTNNQSYHRGDVWFWVNNVAAIALMQCNFTKYKGTIRKLIDTSCQECLSQGAIGHCTEVSSAAELESVGCPVQAWSAATLIELLENYNEQHTSINY